MDVFFRGLTWGDQKIDELRQKLRGLPFGQLPILPWFPLVVLCYEVILDILVVVKHKLIYCETSPKVH